MDIDAAACRPPLMGYHAAMYSVQPDSENFAVARIPVSMKTRSNLPATPEFPQKSMVQSGIIESAPMVVYKLDLDGLIELQRLNNEFVAEWAKKQD